MRRGAVLLVLLFIGLDAAVCPMTCLTDVASHQTSGSPSHETGSNAGCGGACWSGVTVLAVDSSVVPVEGSARPSDHPVAIPARPRVTGIDHPPRLA